MKCLDDRIHSQTFQHFLAPSGGDAIVIRCWNRFYLIQADRPDVSVVFDVIFQVQQCDVMVERLRLILRMEDDLLNADDLEWLWLFVASQSPLSSFNKNVVRSVPVQTVNFMR